MAGEWFAMFNPMGGYICARVKDTSKVVHSGNLEYYGEYSDDTNEIEKTVIKLNKGNEE